MIQPHRKLPKDYKQQRGKRQFIDLKDMKFGEWTVIKQVAGDNRDKWVWECQCSCGKTKNVRSSNLLAGLSRSCGHKRG